MTASKAYFLKGSQYVRYDIAGDSVDPGYPKQIAAGWTGSGDIGFGDGVDAAIDPGNGHIYFFKGSKYLRLDAGSNAVDAGFPLGIADKWPGMGDAGFGDTLDAGARWDDGTIYFFKGASYLGYDATGDAVVGGPFPIAPDWGGLDDAGFGDRLDAVVAWPNGKAYFFKGDQYVRYDIAARTADADFPQPIAKGWPTLAAAGFGDGISAAYVKVSAGGGGGHGESGDASDLSDAFFVAVKTVSAAIGCTPEDLLGVMMSESGVHPWAQNPNGHATGLIQFMPNILAGMGWTAGPDAFKVLSAEDQMPYVQRFFAPWARFGLTSAGRLYQATFLPGTLSQGSDESTVIAGRNGPHTDAYTANTGLDIDGDGAITIGDLSARIDQVRRGSRWDDILRRLAAV